MDLAKQLNTEVPRTGGDYYSFEKGANGFRMLAEGAVMGIHFRGKGVKSATCIGKDNGCPFHAEGEQAPSYKYVTYVLDLKDKKIKQAELPYSVIMSISNFQKLDDWAFQEAPMPYNVNVMHDPDNADPKSKYVTTPSPKCEALTSDQEEELATLMRDKSPEKIVQWKKEKQMKETNGDTVSVETVEKKYDALTPTANIDYPEEEVSVDDIPF